MSPDILEAVKQQLLAFPDVSKDAADLTDAERIALCIASGCRMDYRTEHRTDGRYMLIASTVNPVGIVKIGNRFQVCELVAAIGRNDETSVDRERLRRAWRQAR